MTIDVTTLSKKPQRRLHADVLVRKIDFEEKEKLLQKAYLIAELLNGKPIVHTLESLALLEKIEARRFRTESQKAAIANLKRLLGL